MSACPRTARAPKLFPLLHGRPHHRHPHPLLGREVLRMLQQLLELRQPEVLPYSVHLVGPKKIPSPRGHLQPPTQLGVNTPSSYHPFVPPLQNCPSKEP